MQTEEIKITNPNILKRLESLDKLQRDLTQYIQLYLR
jgi:hypothetical protein